MRSPTGICSSKTGMSPSRLAVNHTARMVKVSASIARWTLRLLRELVAHIVKRDSLGNPGGLIDDMSRRANSRCRTTNWSEHNASLKLRGTLSILFDSDLA